MTAAVGQGAQPATEGAFLIDGQFRVVRALDHGGMARIYLCTYLAGCLVAVKCLGRVVPAGASMSEMDDRFHREAQILLSLRHPAIVAAYTHGFDHANQLRYLVMEYVRGETLGEVRRAAGRPLTATETAELLVPIADALAYCHRRKVFHRDVTPRNILVIQERGTRSSRLVDFGAGWQPDHHVLTGPVVFGSLDYQPLDRTSPEHRHRVDDAHQASIDIYGLAAVAYALTAGEGPGLALLTMDDKLGTRPLEAGPDARWNRLLTLALRRDPATRLPLMCAFRDELKSWVDTNETTLTEPFVEPFWARVDSSMDDAVPSTGPIGDAPSRPIAIHIPIGTFPMAIGSRPDRTPRSGWTTAAWSTLGLVVGAVVVLGLVALAFVAGLSVRTPIPEAPPSVPASIEAPTPEASAPVPEPPPAGVDIARMALVGAGVELRGVEPTRFAFGDGRLHVPEALLEPEMNWEGRTLYGQNPDYPWIALSPTHDVDLGAHELAARPLTWAQWTSLGGSVPDSGPCAGQGPEQAVGCLTVADVASVLNAASLRFGLSPAMDPTTGVWDGVANGLRLPTEAEWEQARLRNALQGGAEWVIDPEPLPDLPGPGAGTLRGHAVVRDLADSPRHRRFHAPTARLAHVGVRLAWSP